MRDDFTTYSGYSAFEGWHSASGPGGAVTRSVLADAGADDGWALVVERMVPQSWLHTPTGPLLYRPLSALRDIARLSAGRLPLESQVGSSRGERNGRVEVPEELGEAEMAETIHDAARRIMLGDDHRGVECSHLGTCED